MTLALRPVTLREARAFVVAHHRHNRPPKGWLFGAGLYAGDELAAVAIAGRPLARALDDGATLEVTRVCTLDQRNAASRLYGALCRAGKALGYARAVTYTLASEPGSSVRAAGFREDARLEPRSEGGWASSSGKWHGGRHDATLWGERILPEEPRVRWVRDL